MPFCEDCGSRIPDGASSCPACGAAVEPSVTAIPYTKPSYYEQARAAQPSSTPLNGLLLAENERIVRQYQCSNVKRPKCTGYLTVTNKRVLFQAKAATSRISKEVVLDSVSGLDCYYGLNINVFGILLGIIMVLGGLALLFVAEEMVFPEILLIVLGGIVIYVSLQKCFFLSIFSSKANGSPISLGAGARTLVGNGALYALVSEPTADTDRMINELGALVQDLQTLGDHAIDKWCR